MGALMQFDFVSPWPTQLSWALDSLQKEKVQMVTLGEQCIDLSMVNPDIAPPRSILDRLVEASFKPDRHRYAIARGIRRLRSAFASKYQRAFGVELDPETDVCCTTGTKEAILNLLSTIIPSGSNVLVGVPTYPVFLAAAGLSGHKIYSFPISDDWSAMVNSIGRQVREHHIHCILLNFPNNPTGTTVPAAFYDQLGRELEGTECFVINDFVYGEMAGQSASLLAAPSLRNRAVETYSLSKAYSVPGWRIGAVLGTSSIVEPFTKRKQWLDYGTFLPLQDAASYALESTSDIVAPTVTEYRRRAHVAKSCLRLGQGVTLSNEGLPFIWVQPAAATGALGSVALSRSILSRAHVAVSPGLMFGSEGWIRIALVQDEPTLVEACSRISQIISSVKERDYSCEAFHSA